MKRKFMFLACVALVAATSCEEENVEKPDVPDTPSDEVVVENLILSEESLTLNVGESAVLTVTIEPAEAQETAVVEWSSADESVASVNDNGEVQATAAGETMIVASCGEVSDTCQVTVTEPVKEAQVGDWYYSDGTWSSVKDDSKEIIGVVFYTGDPTVDDPTLKADFPDCTHGLVVALTADEGITSWQDEYQRYWDEQEGFVGRWAEQNAPEFAGISSGIEPDDNLNKMMGYNNTKVLEAFNAAEENSEWPVNIMEKVDAFREQVAAPATSSGWYLPSVKELSQLCVGDFDGNIWDISDIMVEQRELIASKIQEAGGTDFQTMGYWSSTEYWKEGEEDAYSYVFRVRFEDGFTIQNLKDNTRYRVRMVLAF